MYTSRPQHILYNVQDPLEKGLPMRVSMEENHIGEKLKSSKKQIIWKFVYGGSDRIHEIVLTHSVLSAKKIVEFDGQETLFDPNVTPGLWKHIMILDGCNHEIEVRINDSERQDNPKYDLILDHLPFRRLELYRRRTSRLYDDVYRLPGTIQTVKSQIQHETKVWGPGGFRKPEPQHVTVPNYNEGNIGYQSFTTPTSHGPTVGSYQPPQPVIYQNNQRNEMHPPTAFTFSSSDKSSHYENTNTTATFRRNERRDSREGRTKETNHIDIINQHVISQPPNSNIYSVMFDPLRASSSKQSFHDKNLNLSDPIHLMHDENNNNNNNNNQEVRNSHPSLSDEIPNLIDQPIPAVNVSLPLNFATTTSYPYTKATR